MRCVDEMVALNHSTKRGDGTRSLIIQAEHDGDVP